MIKSLNIKPLLPMLEHLPRQGELKVNMTGLAYLKVDDSYINQLCGLLEDKKISKPDYFTDEAIGAHISIIYPEEGTYDGQEIGTYYSFEILGLFKMTTEQKMYYALQVSAPDLLAIRNRHDLKNELKFKGHHIGLHITIGVIQLA